MGEIGDKLRKCPQGVCRKKTFEDSLNKVLENNVAAILVRCVIQCLMSEACIFWINQYCFMKILFKAHRFSQSLYEDIHFEREMSTNDGTRGDGF